MIIGPDEAVLNQWEDNLKMIGIEADHIKTFSPKDEDLLRHEKDYILMTRYSLMTEIRNLMKGRKSILFPILPEETMSQLRECMVGAHSALGDVKKTEMITKILCSNINLVKGRSFRTLIVDEAHMMKNLATYWAVGVGLLAAVSQRNVPLSGTPFIHGPQDMATLMVFINASSTGSTKQWWKEATRYNSNVETFKSVQKWRGSYFVRREKSILAKELPTKTVSVMNVGCFGSELGVYYEHEKSFFDALTAFSKLSKAQEDKRELVNFLFAQLTCMVSVTNGFTLSLLQSPQYQTIELTNLFFFQSE